MAQTRKVGNMNVDLPFVELPKHFVEMLSNTYTGKDAISSVTSIIRSNPALDIVVEKAFSEFNDGRGLEKVISALGWPNFRERMASLFVYKVLNEKFPEKTHMELVEHIKDFESHYYEHSVHSNSRIFLLGFYFEIARILEEKKGKNKIINLNQFPDTLPLLNLSQARSEKLDWILLILFHFQEFLGTVKLSKRLAAHATFSQIFNELTENQKLKFHSNMLSYGMSIGDTDIFLYERV